MKPENKRKFHRINFDGLANIDFGNDRHTCCQVRNLSLTGMFVAGNFRRQQQELCSIKIFHKEKAANNSLQAVAELVWCNDEGAGIRFTEMTLENYILLQTTLIDKSSKPEKVLREFPDIFPFEITHR